MKYILNFILKNPIILYISALIIAIPALAINLGLNPLTIDEANRGIVAIEMIFSGDYITPTIGGEIYLKKPPLWNWMLAAIFKITGNQNELVMRLLTVFFLLLYAFAIFHFNKKHFGAKIGFINAIAFISCGRVLFWDSMLALIDITFSFVLYLNFMVIYHLHERKKYWFLFMISYILATIAYMFKGLPAIVFQGITILVFFIYKKDFKRLFSIQHIISSILFLILVGSYYLLYFKINPSSGDKIFATLFSESTMRTAVNHNFMRTISHLFTFPFEMLYHFLPWTFLIILSYRKGFLREIIDHPFLKFNGLIFISNLFIYWTSPEVYPRYLLMLVPLFFTIFIYFYEQQIVKILIYKKIIAVFFGVLLIAVTLGTLIIPFREFTAEIPYQTLKSILIFVLLICFFFLFVKLKDFRLLIFGITLLVVRLGFNWFVLPERATTSMASFCKQETNKVVKLSENKELMFYKEISIDYLGIFYLESNLRKIIPTSYGEKKIGTYYIAHPRNLKNENYEVITEFVSLVENRHLKLIKFNAENLP